MVNRATGWWRGRTPQPRATPIKSVSTPLTQPLSLLLPLLSSLLPPALHHHLQWQNQAFGLANIDKLSDSLTEFQAIVEAKDKQAVPLKQREALSYVGNIEEAMVKGFPFQVPKEYADRPLLLVRS